MYKYLVKKEFTSNSIRRLVKTGEVIGLAENMDVIKANYGEHFADFLEEVEEVEEEKPKQSRKKKAE